MNEPTTKAGQSLLANMRSGVASLFAFDDEDGVLPDAVAAVEAEARATAEAQIVGLKVALTAYDEAVKCVPYHRNPNKSPDEECSYPTEGHKPYSCPLCVAMELAEEALRPNRGPAA